MQLPSAFCNFLAIMNGVTSNTGIDIAMNNVCNSVNATDNAIPLAVPMNTDMNVPAQVGHAMNNPVVAPIVLIPLPFFEIVYALTAIAVFKPTRYDTTICNTRFIGIICNPTLSVKYTIIFGMYPKSPQHGATKPEGIVAP